MSVIEGGAPLTDEQITMALDGLGTADDTPGRDAAPAKPRRSRSGSRKPKATPTEGDATRAPRPSRPRTSARKPAVNIKAGMTQLYTLAGIGVSMAPMPAGQAVGLAMGAQAESCATAWEQLAKENPRVKSALEQLLTVSSIGVLLAAHMPIVLAGLAASGKLDGMAGGMSALVPEQSAPAAA